MEDIKWRNAVIEVFANMFFVYVMFSITAFTNINGLSPIIAFLLIGLLYALIVFVFQSAWIDMHPVLSLFKFFKNVRSIQETGIRILMQLVGTTLAVLAFNVIHEGATFATNPGNMSGLQIVMLEFFATALFMMVILRITSLSPNVHTLTTGLGLMGALIISHQYTGGLVSPIWSLASYIGNWVSNGVTDFKDALFIVIGSFAILPLLLWCHFFINHGADHPWDDQE